MAKKPSKDKKAPKVTLELALENLRKQHAEYSQQAKMSQEMVLKSQGGIEVLEALINQEEK